MKKKSDTFIPIGILAKTGQQKEGEDKERNQTAKDASVMDKITKH